MELTFYDSTGAPIAYTADGKHIYLFSGEPVAFIDSGSVYSFSGKHLGRFEKGWIRNNIGQCVFFTENATGGPLRPMKKMRPMKSMKQMLPMKAMKEMKPLKPMDASSWANISGKFFFEIIH